MNEEKIYFYRDNSKESQEAKSTLDQHGIKYEEVYAMQDRELPCILSSNSAMPFCGVSGVNLYVSFFSPQLQEELEKIG